MPNRLPNPEVALIKIRNALDAEELSDEEVVRRVGPLVKHHDAEVREAVGNALREVKHESAELFVRQGLRDRDNRVAEAFIRAAMENNFRSLADEIGKIMLNNRYDEDLQLAGASALREIGHRKEHLDYLNANATDAPGVKEFIKNSREILEARLGKEPKEAPAEDAGPRWSGDAVHSKVLNLIKRLKSADASVRSKAAGDLHALGGKAGAKHPLKRALKYLNPEKHPREFGDLYLRGTSSSFEWRNVNWESCARLLKKGTKLPKRR